MLFFEKQLIKLNLNISSQKTFKMNFQLIKDWLTNIAGFFLIWIILHFIAANLYARFCAELSFLGLIKSIFIAEAPHCMALRWVIYNGGSVIHSMWLSLGVWLSGKILVNLIK